MRAVCLQHVAFEGPGVFAGSLQGRGYQLERRVVPEAGLPEEPGDFLLVMGGPMSVNDPDPWIVQELAYIRDFVESGMPYVGICFGAQLLAKAFGAKVSAASKLELGMTPIWLTAEGKWDPVFRGVPDPWHVFEWHGEAFDVPEGAVPLVKSDVCVQAFVYGPKAYGLLFHPELDRPGIEALCRECQADLSRAHLDRGTVQREAEAHLPTLHAFADRLIGQLTGR